MFCTCRLIYLGFAFLDHYFKFNQLLECKVNFECLLIRRAIHIHFPFHLQLVIPHTHNIEKTFEVKHLTVYHLPIISFNPFRLPHHHTRIHDQQLFRSQCVKVNLIRLNNLRWQISESCWKNQTKTWAIKFLD